MSGENEKRVRQILNGIKKNSPKESSFQYVKSSRIDKEKEVGHYNNLQQARLENYKTNRPLEGNAGQYNQTAKRKEGTKLMAARGIYKAATGPKAMLPARVIRLGNKLRARMMEGDSSAIQIAYLLAFFLDFMDIIPIAAFIFSFIFSPLLFIMLWGYGNWKVKTLRALLLFLEIIPIVGALPLNIVCVMHANHVLKKRIKKAKKKYRELEMLAKTAQ